MAYKHLNNICGWFCFIIALTTYILTLEPSVSFWDCGEFISCAYRLQVSHQPGYPLFAMIGKAFSLLSLGDPTKVAYFMNMASAIASAATVMFLCWTITAFAKKLTLNAGEEPRGNKQFLILGAGCVGALAFAYSDTFWFSAVETIVFALSALCTAIVFWAILKWEAQVDDPQADRWLVFIAYIVGLSIGIHLLNLLSIPAIATIYYFKKSSRPFNRKNILIALVVGVCILAFVQYGIIQYTVKIAAYFDLFFVNVLGLGFGSGASVFWLLFIGALTYGIFYSIKAYKPTLNLAFLCIAFILFGYSSFAMIVIRAKANPNLNNSQPDNAFTLLNYLNRVQYGDRPLFYGPYFDSKLTGQERGGAIYRKGKAKYEVAGYHFHLNYDRNTLLPRMYSDQPNHVNFYKSWMRIADGQSPMFKENIGFMFSWQIWQMYFRYFLWNFVGRYNDNDGQNSIKALDGNWTSGLFDQAKELPQYVLKNVNYSPLYGLPFLLGLIGLIWHFKKKQEDAYVIALLFFFTGLAIVLYLNQPPEQPRERDYSYVSSFYAFCIWVGMGVIPLAEWLKKITKPTLALAFSIVIGLLSGPFLMARQEWGHHDRSTQLTPHDVAYNYLNSCAKNAILFTYGDNDTYPLWYIQEVEGVRRDVRIINLSLLGMDWYIRQMKCPMNLSAPVPITMPDEKYVQGVRDVLYYNDANIPGHVELKDLLDVLLSDHDADKLTYENGVKVNFLPTKKLKLSVDPAEVLATKTLEPQQKNEIIPVMEWEYSLNHVSKAELAVLQILANNHWKRPIYFATTVPPSSLIGLNKFLFKEGLTYRLLPLKAKGSANGSDQINTWTMYKNVMTKFKWGNMKKARYLDHESRVMVYPVYMLTFFSLANHLLEEGKPLLASQVLKKCDDVLPNIESSYPQSNVEKFYLVELALRANCRQLAEKWLNCLDAYIFDQLDYQERLFKKDLSLVNMQQLQFGVALLDAMVKLSSNYNLPQKEVLNNKMAQYKHMFAAFSGH